MKKILLSAPLHQKIKYFNEFQKSIDNLLIPQGYSLDRFFIVNDCPEITPFIKNAKYITMNFNSVQEQTHIWQSKDIDKMIVMRNTVFTYANDLHYDYVFSVDTDLVLQPLTLKFLLDANTDIVSEIFWNNTNGIWYNGSHIINWEYNGGSDACERALEQYRTPGVYPIGMTGACTLISSNVWKAGVDYSNIPYNYPESISEDRNFCIRALVHGFQPMIDTHCPPVHLFSEKEYAEYIRNRYNDYINDKGTANDN